MSAGVIGYVGRLRAALAPDADDAALVRAYATSRDADAFAALVRRHGPRVWATCRRVVGDPHAAEDAFQATFLVLARKATGLSASRPLGGWLHVVAVNVSVRARTAADRRKRREVSGDAEAVAPTPPEPTDERALAALDEELAKLPAKLRDAVVLCELDGLSRREAADRLGVPEGTLSSRLAAARKRLADRLTGRGVGPEALAVPAAAVPAALAEAATGLGVGAVPAPAVLALAGGTMRAMLLKGLAAGAVACGLLAVGGLAKDEPPAKPVETPAPVAAKPDPVAVKPAPAAAPAAPPVATKPTGPSGLLVGGLRVGRRPALLTEDGNLVPTADHGAYPTRSPDGVWVASTQPTNKPTDRQRPEWRVEVRRMDGTGEPIRVPFNTVPNGFVVARWESATAVVVRQIGTKTEARFDLSNKTLTLPTDDLPAGPTPVVPAGRELAGGVAVSPDGNRLLYLDRRADGAAYPTDSRLCVYDRPSRATAVLAEAGVGLEFGTAIKDGDVITPGSPMRLYSLPPGSGAGDNVYRSITTDGYEIRGYCWSPDGKRVAFDRSRVRGEVGRGSRVLWSAVRVCDTDGSHSRELYGTAEARLSVVDWR